VNLEADWGSLRGCSKAEWDLLPEEITYGLTYDELQRVKDYGAIVATPILDKKGQFRGCVSVDAPVGKLLRQVQKMQEEMARLQEQLADRTVETSAGGGAVTAVVSGRLELKSLRIDPAAIDPDDPEMLQDLVIAAVNDVLRRAQEMVQQAMARIITGGLGLPGLSGLF
jgi:DNA-binding YbaB/EbfC family protein